MPPRIRHDDVYDQGGIEVVVIDEDDDGAIVENRVLFVPHQQQRKYQDDEEEEGYDENDFFDESVELTGNFLDHLLSGLGCAGCTPFDITEPPRRTGILKKPGDAPALNSRNVSFSSLEIKEFDLTLGNHPNSCSGPPIMLDWEAKKTERTISLDEYEQERVPRRKRRQLRMSYKDRQRILEGQKGFSTEEVNRAWAEALSIQKQRQETLKRGMFLMTVDDFWESTQRKCKRMAESIGMA